MKAQQNASGKSAVKNKAEPLSPYVEASFAFVDSLKQPISGLTVRLEASADAVPAPAWVDAGAAPAVSPAVVATAETPAPIVSPASAPTLIRNSLLVITKKNGFAAAINNVARNQPINVLVKKKNGQFSLKGKVTPTKDVNAYTITSPEYHVTAETKLSGKDGLETDIPIPTVKEGEVMTVNRLLTEFALFLGRPVKVTEEGKVKKDFPKSEKIIKTDPETRKSVTKIEIEHHYKAVKTDEPRTVLVDLLPSRLNYPTSLKVSDEEYEAAAKEIGCEMAAVKAVAETESSGQGFISNGLCKVRYERHYFFRLSLRKDKQGRDWEFQKNPFPGLPDLCWPKSKVGPEGLPQYALLMRAVKLNREVALQSCSWGAFQVMGEYYSMCGYQSAEEMANVCMASATGQLEIFVRYIQKVKPRAGKALREHTKLSDECAKIRLKISTIRDDVTRTALDAELEKKVILMDSQWTEFTKNYNGIYWRDIAPNYPSIMKINYEKFKK